MQFYKKLTVDYKSFFSLKQFQFFSFVNNWDLEIYTLSWDLDCLAEVENLL